MSVFSNLTTRLGSAIFGCLICGFMFSLVLETQLAKAQTFDEFREQQRRAQASFETAERSGTIMQAQAFEAFRIAEEARFTAFRNEMMERWGSFNERTQSRYTEYAQNGNARWEFDFETGEVAVEVLAEAGESEEALRQRLQQAISSLAESRGTVEEYLAEDPQPATDQPVLAGQLDSQTEAELRQKAEKLAEQAEISSVPNESRQQQNTGETPVIMRTTFTLIPDHIRVRAERFRENLLEHSSRYDLDPALVLAVIHTESFFNPVARSHANALGLMQIVPTSAGRDVYRQLNGQDGIPAPDFLYDPDNNLLFGTTYLDILRSRYITGVSSPLVHEYMIISAYNTGAGNVARAYTGSTSVRAAVRRANEMSPEENFAFLIENLPYEETRNYLQKVTERRENYSVWLNSN
ncbi:MAG: murein transglycosylase domain-containing protein [Balneolales bacterium]|nr:murein transglycosylase domain-containing protein [Balneolales bacterium]